MKLIQKFKNFIVVFGWGVGELQKRTKYIPAVTKVDCTKADTGVGAANAAETCH
jgi:hypothetical protein